VLTALKLQKDGIGRRTDTRPLL